MGRLEDDEPTGNIEGIDADALLSQIESGGNTEVPMQGQAPAEEPQAPQTPEEFEINWNGKVIKAPRDKALQWASQGYDYAQRMAQFNQERQGFETKTKEFEQKYSKYSQIDEYAAKNPQWWSHVESSYQQAAQNLANAQNAGAPDSEIAALREQVKDLLEFKNQTVEERQAKKREAEDAGLESEVQSIREEFKDLDWKTLDDQGQSLEQRVLDHAIKNDIKSFKTAFRDYNYDQLLKRAEERGKENTTKELQKRTKLGLLGTSPTPKKGIGPAEGVKEKSYDQLLREAKEELGIA